MFCITFLSNFEILINYGNGGIKKNYKKIKIIYKLLFFSMKRGNMPKISYETICLRITTLKAVKQLVKKGICKNEKDALQYVSKKAKKKNVPTGFFGKTIKQLYQNFWNFRKTYFLKYQNQRSIQNEEFQI